MTTPLDYTYLAQPETEDLQNALQILRGELQQGTREHFLTEAYMALSAAEVLVTKALAKMLAREKVRADVERQLHPNVAPF